VTSQRGGSLAVEVPSDEPGAIGRILGRLAEAGVRIEGNAKSGTTLRVLTPDLALAHAALQRQGVVSTQSDVLVITVVSEAGGVSQALQRATEAGLKITFMYLVSESRIVVEADDLDALAALFPAGA
jgi:hypothetical protein